ncbi:MAG: hypothetical protein A4E73_03721 [Syntrophaceae bacterium PtaU1.Bin231]|nr:MAG: hypothetical protein A4E73_03721 [Syntrophaceae bacterium PtaU1.Bin231]
MTAIFRTPYCLRMCSIMIASMLTLQKPRAPCTTSIAWCPGGRTSAKALSTSFFITLSAAVIAPPAEIRCDSVTTPAASGTQMWARSIWAQVASPGLYSMMLSKSRRPSSNT